MESQSNLLPASIELRALKFMETGKDAIEAVQLAIEEENNMIWLVAHGIDMNTGRIRTDIKEAVQSAICKRVYNRINNL